MTADNYPTSEFYKTDELLTSLGIGEALTAQPEQADLLYETALLAEKLGLTDILESRLRKLIELRPESAQAYNALGYSYADRNIRLTEALALIAKALKLAWYFFAGPVPGSVGC